MPGASGSRDSAPLPKVVSVDEVPDTVPEKAQPEVDEQAVMRELRDADVQQDKVERPDDAADLGVLAPPLVAMQAAYPAEHVAVSLARFFLQTPQPTEEVLVLHNRCCGH